MSSYPASCLYRTISSNKCKTASPMRIVVCALVLALLALIAAPARAQIVTATPSDPDEPHGIAINPVTNKIYLADYDGTLTVLDGATNTISTTTNPNGASYWAVAVNPVTNYVFVLNRATSALDVYTGAIGSTPASYVESISTGNNPFALAVNPETNTVYVCNDGSGTVTAVQFSGNSATPTQISLGGDLPTSAAVNPATNMVYVLDYNDGLVFVVNGSTNTLATLPNSHPNPISVGSSPASLAINSVTNTIYVANQGSNNISIISGATGLVTATLSDPNASQPVGIAVNPETNQIYVANMASSNTTIINGANNAVTDVPTSAGSSASTLGTSIAVDTTTNIAYIASTGSGSVTSVNGSTLATNTVTTQAFTWAIAVNPVTHKVYAAPLDFNHLDDTPTTFSVLANTTANVATPAYPQSQPWAVAVNPVTNTIFVADNASNTVSVIDGSTNTLDPASPIPVGTNPNALVVDSINNLVYVSNNASSSVSVINGASLSSPPSTVTLANADVTPNLLAFNPVLNQIYGADTSDSLGFEFAGGTGDRTVFANSYSGGTTPIAIGTNPAQGYNYAVFSTTDSIQFSDVHGTAVINLLCNNPTAADVNTVTNTVYVACGGSSGTLEAIQGADSFTPGSSTTIPLTGNSSNPTTVVVNPVTNTIYVTDEPVENVAYLYVVNASNNNSVTTINIGNDNCYSPSSLAVNTVSNRIYVLCGGDDNEPGPQVEVFDGTTYTLLGVLPVGSPVNTLPNEIAANPVTGNIYALAYQGGNPGALSVYTENTLTNDSLTTSISLAANSNNSGSTTNVASPVFTFTATNSFTSALVTGVFFQVDTQQGNWTAAGPTTQANTFTGTAANLAPGFHIMYAYATDGEDASSANDGLYSTQGSPVTGAISSYGFLVAPPIATVNSTSSNNPMNFGTVPVGSASPSPNPILINNGGAASSLSYTITIGGADPGDFVVDPNQSSCDTNGGALASNTSCEVYVSFQPTATGPATATLTWTDNSLGVSNSTQVVYLSGTGGSTTVPMPTINEEASNPSYITSDTFSWSETDGNVTSYLCSLASGPSAPAPSSDYMPCTSPSNISGLAENTWYAYAIEAVDNQGNVSQPFVDTWEVIPSAVDLTIAGTGTGTVTSTSPTGLNCSSNCNVNFDGVEVTLTAAPGPNSTFAGWSGATAGIPGNNCSGAGTCMLNTAYGPQPVTATFTSNVVQYALSVTLSGTGTGTVTDGATLNCTETNGGAQTGTCSVNYNSGTQVTLTANPTAPSTFVIWGGACASSGTGNSCVVQMTAAQNVTAQFMAGPQGPMAYVGLGTEAFGTISLTNGTFTQSGTTMLGASDVKLSGIGVSGGTLYGGGFGSGQLYQVNPANGSLTAIGPPADFNYFDTGSTTSGVFAVDQAGKLYSVDVATGSASTIGSTGLTLTGSIFMGLSTGSPTLYLTLSSTPSSPALLYSINTINGAATLIGNTGVVDLGAMAFENGVLYAGSGSASGPWSIYSLNTSTGLATLVTTTSSGSFWGLAPLGVNIITLGTGTGTVTDNQNYIDCTDAAGVQSGTCFADYSPGTQVTLTANTTIGTFGGWGGDCASANPSTTCSLTLSSSMTVIADFVAPPVVTPLTFQPSAIPETQQATFNCTTDPCTDPNGNGLALTVQAVTSASPFTVYVIETEVSALQGNGLCPPNGSPSTFLPCRYVTFFGDGTDPNGNTIVPLSVPYANGNPVHYEVNSTGVLGGPEPNPSSYLGPVEWVITWNNDTFVPFSYWAGGTPQLYDDPDGLPAGTPGAIGTNCSQPMTNNITGEPETYSCQFEFNITTYYNPTEPIDSGIGGTTRQFNDVNVAYAPTSQGTGSVTQPPLTQTAPTITGACTAGTTCTLTNTTVGLTSGSAGSFIVSPAGFPPPTLSESGTLPPGMTLNTFTGVLGGIPTTPGSYPVTFTATNSVTSVQQMYTFSVTGITTTTTISSSPTVTYPAAGVVQVTVSSNSGTPTGNVTLSVDGATPLSEPLSSGVATFTISGLSATTHSLSASYAAQGNYGASGPATGSLTVNPASTNISITSSPTVTYPANGVVKVTVSSASVTPTGNVTLTLNSGSPLTAPLSSGVATFTISGLNAATYTLSASYAAQGNFAASGPATGSLTVSPASTSISISAPTVTYPANASIQVTVSSSGGTPTGSVSLTVNSGTPMTGTLSSGVATFTLTSPSPGTYNLSASYAAQGNFAASGPVTGTLMVNPAASTLTFTPSALNYGTVYVGQTTLQSLIITNTGTSMVTFTSFSIAAISGDDSTGFLGVEFCPKTLNPGKSCPVIMSFTADSNVTKTHAANLVVADNASGSPQMILMSATVINPIASLSPTSLSFGTQKTSTTSAAKPITLKNTGTTTLTLSGLSISGNFALATGTSCTKTTVLTSGSSCVMEVTFTPTSKGSKSGSITITDNAENSPQSVPLSGTGD